MTIPTELDRRFRGDDARRVARGPLAQIDRAEHDHIN